MGLQVQVSEELFLASFLGSSEASERRPREWFHAEPGKRGKPHSSSKAMYLAKITPKSLKAVNNECHY